MHIPPKCRLAVMAMIDLALRQDQGPVPLSAISARNNVSPSYLDMLFGRLRRQGLVTGMRGPGGGYLLARSSTTISIADIVSAVDDGSPSDAGSRRSFADRPPLGQRIDGDWCTQIEQSMLRLLGETSLEDMVAPQRRLLPAKPAVSPTAGLPTAKGVGTRERMVIVAANSVFGRPLRLAI